MTLLNKNKIKVCLKRNLRVCPERSRRACPERSRRVFVAMSGGVDSSVAALLLKRQGYDVTGVFMKYWVDAESAFGVNENHCCSLEARRDAMRVCVKIDIPFLTWDFQKIFKRVVADDFIHGYRKGITPNSCVVCNKEIKFGLFIRKALEMGADYIATGHYVKFKTFNLKHDKSASCFTLHVSRDTNKDQSYFLWTLTQKQLKHCLFPLGNYTKPEVRNLAKKFRLPTTTKKDSQEVCFVGKTNLKEFLKKWLPEKQGKILNTKGEILGSHLGVWFFTIGQRQGIKLSGGPYFVVSKDIKKNILVVAKEQDKSLFSKKAVVGDINWISGQTPKLPLNCLIRIRYRQPLQKATILACKGKRISVSFEKPQKAITQGQSAVFYKKDGEMIGGGVLL